MRRGLEVNLNRWITNLQNVLLFNLFLPKKQILYVAVSHAHLFRPISRDSFIIKRQMPLATNLQAYRYSTHFIGFLKIYFTEYTEPIPYLHLSLPYMQTKQDRAIFIVMYWIQ